MCHNQDCEIHLKSIHLWNAFTDYYIHFYLDTQHMVHSCNTYCVFGQGFFKFSLKIGSNLKSKMCYFCLVFQYQYITFSVSEAKLPKILKG